MATSLIERKQEALDDAKFIAAIESKAYAVVMVGDDPKVMPVSQAEKQNLAIIERT